MLYPIVAWWTKYEKQENDVKNVKKKKKKWNV